MCAGHEHVVHPRKCQFAAPRRADAVIRCDSARERQKLVGIASIAQNSARGESRRGDHVVEQSWGNSRKLAARPVRFANDDNTQGYSRTMHLRKHGQFDPTGRACRRVVHLKNRWRRDLHAKASLSGPPLLSQNSVMGNVSFDRDGSL